MSILEIILVSFVALEHLYFLILEMFLWNTPKGIKTFSLESAAFAEKTKVLAANQGLYNGFLAAGLIWTFFITDNHWQAYVAIFFLSCVTIAGIYGALTADKKIFFVQALPALIALVLLHLH